MELHNWSKVVSHASNIDCVLLKPLHSAAISCYRVIKGGREKKAPKYQTYEEKEFEKNKKRPPPSSFPGKASRCHPSNEAHKYLTKR